MTDPVKLGLEEGLPGENKPQGGAVRPSPVVAVEKPRVSSSARSSRDKTRYAIDIGSYSLKVIAYEPGLHNPIVKRMEQIPYRERFDYTETEEKRADLVREALERFLQSQPEGKTVLRRVSMTLPSSLTFIQRTVLPFVKGSMLDQAVEFEVKDKFPIPLAELIWDYLPLSHKSDKLRTIILAAARRSAVNQIYSMARSMNFHVDHIGVGPAIVYENLSRKVRANENLLVLDLGAHTTDVIVVGAKGFWSRTITFGGYKVMRWAADRLSVTGEQAEHRINTAGFLDPELAPVLEAKLEELLLEIKRTLTIYRQEVGEGEFNSFFLAGGMACVPGLRDFLTHALNLPPSKILISDFIPDKPQAEVFFQAACLARSDADRSINLLPDEEKQARSITRFKKAFFGYAALGCVMLSLVLLGAQTEAARLRQAEKLVDERLSGLEADKAAVRGIEDKMAPWLTLFQELETSFRDRVEVQKILAGLAPLFYRNLWLDSFQYDAAARKVTIDGKSREKLAGTERLREKLEESAYFKSVEVTDGGVDPDGTRRFRFTMEIQS